MNHHTRKMVWYLCIIIAGLTSLAVLASSVSSILGIQMQPNLRATKIVFTLSKPTSVTVTEESDPASVVIHFKHARKNLTTENAQLAGSNIKTIHAINTKDHGVKFIFEVKEKVKWVLKTEKNKKSGMVVTLDIVSHEADHKTT